MVEINNRINLSIYVPLKECSCLWSPFMNSIFDVLMPYMKLINFETKDLHSPDAKQLKIGGKCVVVNAGEKRFTSPYRLRIELPKLLKEKGLITT